MITALSMVQEIMRVANMRVPTTIDGTTDRRILRVIDDLNYVGLRLGRWTNYRFMEKRWSFSTVAEYTAGDVDVTNESRIVTSNNAATIWTGGMVGRAFKTDAYEEVYRITRFISSTSLELDHPFHGTTATDGSYTIAQDEYLLPEDFDLETNVLQFATPRELRLVSSEEFDRRRFHSKSGHVLGTTSGLVTDDPEIATIRWNRDGRLVLVLDPFPKDSIQILIDYQAELKELSRDNDQWPFPNVFRSVIRDGVLQLVRRNDQDDARSQFDLQEFFMGRDEVAALMPRTRNHPQFSPDTGRRRLARRRRHISSATHDLGSLFDRS